MWSRELSRLMPQLGVDLSGDDGGQHVLFEAIVQLLAHAARRTKLVLVIDDLHWIDPASRELLRYVAANLRRTPILLVAAYRPEDSAAERELIAQLGRLGSHRIALDGLADDAAAEMATFLLGTEDGSPDIERIARDAGGNPLFLEELIAARDEALVPQTLRDLLSVRFNSLDDDARHLVRTAALIGPRAPRAWLIGATGLDDARARHAARAAVDAGLLLTDDDGRGYAFRHALLRQAVLDDFVPDERVELHRAIAEALDEHPERAVGIDRVAELARHWDAAEVASPALRWLVAAAQQADASYAFEAAFEAYERALFWWSAVPEPATVVDIDHVALLIAAADAAGFAGHIDRAADLGRAGLDEACAIDLSRGVDAAGRVFSVMWLADRATELHEFATTALLPQLDHVDAAARARFLVSHVEYLTRNAPPTEVTESATLMMAAVRNIADPALEARAHIVMADYYEMQGIFDRVDEEYEQAATIARHEGAHSTHALATYNHAASQTSVPNWDGCLKLLDEVDDIVARYGLRRYFVPARCLRALALSLQGDLQGCDAVLASLDDLVVEGFDAWFRATTRASMLLFGGDFDGAIHVLDPGAVGAAAPDDPTHAIELAIWHADASSWKDDLGAARAAVDEGEAAVARHRETYWQGWLAMVAMRVEADAAIAATAAHDLDGIEHAQARADLILTNWKAAIAQLQGLHPLVRAYACAIDAELARLRGSDVATTARLAAETFTEISLPYYATYFRWREAEATLAADRPTGIALLQQARGTARTHGFAGLDDAISTLARTHQLRVGPGKTTIDGDEPLSTREIEVLRLLVDGKTNPEIAEELFITRRTAAAHVSGILRKLGVTSRVEAVSDAHRRGLI